MKSSHHRRIRSALEFFKHLALLILDDKNEYRILNTCTRRMFLGAYQGHSTPVGTRKIEFLNFQIEFLPFFNSVLGICLKRFMF